MAIQNLAGITVALCVFACVGSGHANLQPDISQLTGLDVPEGLKQYIGSMVSGLQADKEALQAMQAQIDELKKDRDTLQIAQNQQPLQPNINKTEASAIARQASFGDVVSTWETARQLQETTTPGGCSGDQLAARGQAAMQSCCASDAAECTQLPERCDDRGSSFTCNMFSPFQMHCIQW